MLGRAREFREFRFLAQGKEFGRIANLYFESSRWIVRYFVLETERFRSHRVLLTPAELDRCDLQQKMLGTALSKEQIRASRRAAEVKPVSRRHEIPVPGYWRRLPFRRRSSVPPPPPPLIALAMIDAELSIEEPDAKAARAAEPHLQSVEDIVGYSVRSSGGERIGYLRDFLIRVEGWTIPYAIVDMGFWVFGRRMLIPTVRVRSIDWRGKNIAVDASSHEITGSPSWKRGATVSSEFISSIDRHYGIGKPA